ncbi:MAG: hypothetical protein C4530_00700 [Desulfobacteraceae bacterium]|nr:MAG: hypothetical protein C4530_00700 [Desulfobacteraceae bacterium]
MTDNEFCTATLARLYVKQGHLRKAAGIYRRLVQREPDRSELAVELSEIEDRLCRQATEVDSELLPLFGRWIEMLLHYRRLKSLDRLRKRFSDG